MSSYSGGFKVYMSYHCQADSGGGSRTEEWTNPPHALRGAQEVRGGLGLWHPLCKGSLQDPSLLACHHLELDLTAGTFWAHTHSAKVTETARPTASGERVRWHKKRILLPHGAPREHCRLDKLQN